MNKDNWKEYRTLQNAGWDVQKHNQVRFNGGSETVKHAVSKMLVAHAGHNAGYRVSSEVCHDERGEIDVLLFGNPDRLTLAIECETSPTMDTVSDKADRYLWNTPIDDMIMLNVGDMPMDMVEAYDYVKGVIGL